MSNGNLTKLQIEPLVLKNGMCCRHRPKSAGLNFSDYAACFI